MSDETEVQPKQPPTGTPRSQRAPIPGPVPASETQRSSYPPGGPALQSLRPPAYGQGVILSVVVAAVVLVLAIIVAGEGEDTGIPMTEATKPIFWGLAALLIVGAGAFAQYVEISTARLSPEGATVGTGRKPGLPTAWAGPVVATLAAVLLVATYHNTAMLIVGPAVAFLGNASALFARDLLSDATASTERTAVAVHSVVLHIIAFLALSTVYLNKMSSLWGGLLVFAISTILFLELLDVGVLRPAVRVLYALGGGWLMAQCLLLVNWWPTYGWTGGAVLLVCFALIAMALTAIAQAQTPNRRDLALYGVVAVIALAVLAVTA
jgi:hypothetical protein